MRFIQKWSYSCAWYLARTLNENHEKRGVYYYGFQIVIGSIVKGVALILLSLLAGAFAETMAVMLFFVYLRVYAGGYHMETYGKCMVTSLVIFLLSGVFVRYTLQYWNTPYIFILSTATFLAGIYILVRWAPADTPNKPIKKPERIRKLKTISLAQLCVWWLATVILLNFRLNMLALAGCLGILNALFIVTPAGYKFF